MVLVDEVLMEVWVRGGLIFLGTKEVSSKCGTKCGRWEVGETTDPAILLVQMRCCRGVFVVVFLC